MALGDLKGRYVVLYFYPRDNTPGCTTEAQGFRDHLPDFEERNAVVLGVSKDSMESHHKFIAKQDLNFALLSDIEGKTVEAYEAWGEKKMYGKSFMGILRKTVVIDPQGKVAKIFPKVKVKTHAEDVLAALDELA